MNRPKKDKETKHKLEMAKHSRERTLMPRPTVFKDKTKYDRKQDKKNIRRDDYDR